MKYSRRDMGIAAFAMASAAPAQEAMPSRAFQYEDLTVKTNGKNRSRDVLKGKTHQGYALDMHLTELAAGEMPHAAHHHEHEEMVMIQTGTLEVTISGKVSTVGAGSVVYVASNEEHGWRNVGSTRAQYFVMAFGR